MKKSLLIYIAASISMLSCIHSSSSISESEAEQLMNNFFTALSTADTTLMNQITSDDFLLYEHDTIWNTDSLLSLMPRTRDRIWQIQDFNFTTDGDIAHFNYYNESGNPIGRSWYESGLITKTEEGLKLKFMHSTKLYLSK